MKELIPAILPTPIPGDTLYVLGDGEYRLVNGSWTRILPGPHLNTPADVEDVYGNLFATIDALSDGSGPPVNPKIVSCFNELKKVFGG
jgi:hypothetical protein